MMWCIEQSGVEIGATVLDPYMGSGTTGIACIRTGRRFIGIEKDPTHYATALDRIRRELAQGQLFEPAEIAPPKQLAMEAELDCPTKSARMAARL